MKQITIITGGRATGKSTLADILLKDKKYTQINSRDLESPFMRIKKDSDFLFIDEVAFDDDVIMRIRQILRNGRIEFERPQKPKFTIHNIKFLLVSNSPISNRVVNKLTDRGNIKFDHFQLTR